MSMRLDNLWNVVFVAIIAALLCVGVVAFSRLNALATATRQVERTYHVLRTIDRSVWQLTQAEANARGFVLTGDPAFLEPFELAAREAPLAVNSVRDLVLDDPRQVERADRLRDFAERRLALLDSRVRLTAMGQREEAMTSSGTLRGKQIMDEFHSIADEMERTEDMLLAAHGATAAKARDTSYTVVGAAIAIAVALAGIAALVNFETGRRRQQLERESADREAAQVALRVRERDFSEIANSMPQIVWTTDANGVPDYFNERWHEYTGIDRSAGKPSDWRDRVHPDDAVATRRRWQHCLETGEPFQAEHRLRSADAGAHRWFMSRAVALRGSDGAIVRWFGTSTDIEDQKRLADDREALLVAERSARSEAERASRLKDEFVATVSHELRTPLNAVLGWTRILQGSHDAATLHQGLDVIERNARTQARLVEDLLDMSRAMEGKLRLELQDVDLAAIVAAALETIRPAANAKGVTLEASLPPDAPPIAADPNRIQQIAWNLVSNAIKFTPRGGHVDVSLERCGSSFRLVVADTGQGIAPEFLPLVFDRFRQADGSTTRRHGGLGLGLAIVRHLVELHGGGVEVRSPGVGRGATFIVVLPIAVLVPRSANGASSSHEGAMPRLDGLRVLVVDDNRDARELVSRLLADRGAHPIAAGSASEALRAVGTAAPDMIVSDIGMPDCDGVDLIREVREIELATGRTMPAIALSALARPEDRHRAIAAGYDLHLAKPVEPADLVAAVARLAKVVATDGNGRRA
ncbi:MAG: CHASE3 domain-containing protein [Phycisphaerales bacterium]